MAYSGPSDLNLESVFAESGHARVHIGFVDLPDTHGSVGLVGVSQQVKDGSHIPTHIFKDLGISRSLYHWDPTPELLELLLESGFGMRTGYNGDLDTLLRTTTDGDLRGISRTEARCSGKREAGQALQHGALA